MEDTIIKEKLESTAKQTYEINKFINEMYKKGELSLSKYDIDKIEVIVDNEKEKVERTIKGLTLTEPVTCGMGSNDGTYFIENDSRLYHVDTHYNSTTSDFTKETTENGSIDIRRLVEDPQLHLIKGGFEDARIPEDMIEGKLRYHWTRCSIGRDETSRIARLEINTEDRLFNKIYDFIMEG